MREEMIDLILAFVAGEVFTILLVYAGYNWYCFKKQKQEVFYFTEFPWGSYDPSYPEYSHPLKGKEDAK
jgi:hypothetical protein